MNAMRVIQDRPLYRWVDDRRGGVESPGLIFIVLALIGASVVVANDPSVVTDLFRCGLGSWSQNFC